MSRLVLLLLLSGCAGGPAAVVPTTDPAGAYPGGGSPAPPAAVRAPVDSLWCVSSDASPVEVLGWLVNHGLIDGTSDPWTRLFYEPPLTGPRPGVDTTRYVELWERVLGHVGMIVWPDDPNCTPIPGDEWPPGQLRALADSTWRCGLFAQCAPDSAPPDTSTTPPDSVGIGGSFDSGDFEYLGSFALPHALSGGEGTKLYEGGARGLDVDNEGKLWLTTRSTEGGNPGGLVGAVSIPEPSLSRVVAELPRAEVLVPATDLSGGLIASIGGEIPRAGDVLVALGDTLVTAWDSYNAASQDRLGLAINRTRLHVGPRREGDPTNPTHYQTWCCGLVRVDPAWAERYAPDVLWIGTGGEREAGGTYGSPCGFSARGFGRDVSRWTSLVRYTPEHPAPRFSRCRQPSNELCSTDTASDAVWLRVGNRSALTAIVSKCDSTSYYANVDQAGACRENKGQVCDSAYRFELWIFDDLQLGEVALGQREEWDVSYWVVDLTDDLFPRCQVGTLGAAFRGGRLYVAQGGVDGEYPIVHVWGVR